MAQIVTETPASLFEQNTSLFLFVEKITNDYLENKGYFEATSNVLSIIFRNVYF